MTVGHRRPNEGQQAHMARKVEKSEHLRDDPKSVRLSAGFAIFHHTRDLILYTIAFIDSTNISLARPADQPADGDLHLDIHNKAGTGRRSLSSWGYYRL